MNDAFQTCEGNVSPSQVPVLIAWRGINKRYRSKGAFGAAGIWLSWFKQRWWLSDRPTVVQQRGDA